LCATGGALHDNGTGYHCICEYTRDLFHCVKFLN
jgi:hypothetical protein